MAKIKKATTMTLYVRERDKQTWAEAAEVAKNRDMSLSTLCVSLLKRYLSERERDRARRKTETGAAA